MVDLQRQTPMQKRINAILGELIAQRQLLQNSPADRTLLASNGASIAYWQSKLRGGAESAASGPQELIATLVSATEPLADEHSSRSRSRSTGPPTLRSAH